MVKVMEQTHKNNKALTAFVTGLCGLFREEDLKTYLESKCPGIVSVSLPNKRRAGYAFVEAQDKETLEKLLKMRHLSFNGRELLLKRFLKGEELEQFKQEVNSRRLFVYSIPSSWVDEDLRDIFKSYGKIEDAYVIRDRRSKKSRCFGYAIFEEKAIAEDVAKLDYIPIRGSIIRVKMHEPKRRKPEGSSKKSKMSINNPNNDEEKEEKNDQEQDKVEERNPQPHNQERIGNIPPPRPRTTQQEAYYLNSRGYFDYEQQSLHQINYPPYAQNFDLRAQSNPYLAYNRVSSSYQNSFSGFNQPQEIADSEHWIRPTERTYFKKRQKLNPGYRPFQYELRWAGKYNAQTDRHLVSYSYNYYTGEEGYRSYYDYNNHSNSLYYYR